MRFPVFQAIQQRRSIREFTRQPVQIDDLRQIVRAGIWAPSGLNNQPWRFVLIQEREVMDQIAEQTRYSHIIKAAPALIAVYLDTSVMYDEVKDHQAAGACIQNMLLCTEELGLGAVWLGQILQNKHHVSRIVNVDETFDLMAVLAIGYPAHRTQQSKRNQLADFILHEIRGDST